MLSTTTPVSSRRPGHRVLAAAALAAALALTACSSDDAGDGAGAAPDQSSDPMNVTTAAEEPDQAPADRAPGAPDTPVAELVLNDRDAPELGLVAIPADQIAEGVDAMGGITEGARVEPAECADFGAAAMDGRSAPDTTAIQTGQAGETPVSVAVSTVTAGITDQRAMVERCPEMTMFLPLNGAEAQVESSNRLLPGEAPEGVEHFVALEQESTVEVAGVTHTTTNIVINGAVRGIGVTVSAVGINGPVPDDARDAAMAAFATQAEKIRNA